MQSKIFKNIPYTYWLIWTKQGMNYIGSRSSKNAHPDDLWTKYFTSSRYVHEFVKIHGNPDVKNIESTFSCPGDAKAREDFLLRKYDAPNNPAFLNKALQGVYNPMDPDIRENIRRAQLGKKLSDAHKEKLRVHMTGKKMPEGTGARISAKLKGRGHSPQHIENQRQKMIGRKLSEEHKAKISPIGRKWTPEQRIKFCSHKRTPEQKERMRNAQLGKKCADVTKAKISASHKGKTLSIETRKKIGGALRGRKYSPDHKARTCVVLTKRNKEIAICPHCNKSGGRPSMLRHHFINCKLLKTENSGK